jgi:DNA-directed RNA polymerase specialized sigma24 family protein
MIELDNGLLWNPQERMLKTKPQIPKNFYVDNHALYDALVDWQKATRSAHRKKLPNPALPDYIAECMMKMATRLSQKAGFVNYTYREDMIGDALESCLRYIHNFNPKRSTNAFAYITQIIHNAFIRRIQKEQKQLYVKMRIVDEADFAHSYERQDGDTTHYNNSYVTYLQENKGDVISKFENWKEQKKSKANAKKKTAQLATSLFTEEPQEVAPAPKRSKKKVATTQTE